MAEKLLMIAFLAALALSGLAITAFTSGSHTAPIASEVMRNLS